MAATKKDISAFQKAMLSNTKVIGNEENKKKSSSGRRASASKSAQNDSSLIPQELQKKYETLAKDLNIKPKEAIELALNHFLDLKGFLNA